MKAFIGLIIAFLILVYVYTFIKIRKKRKNKTDIVSNYNQQYIKKGKQSKISNNKDSNYEKFITRYNSQIDYIEKDKL